MITKTQNEASWNKSNKLHVMDHKGNKNVSNRKPYPRKDSQALSVWLLEWEEQKEKEARAIYAQSYWDRTLSLNPVTDS